MFSWLGRTALACLAPVRRYVRMNKDEEADDALFWSQDNGEHSAGGCAVRSCRDIGEHSAGEFSFAVVQANERIEDHSQVETGPMGTFVGVYDGHGGPEAARFIADHLFLHFIRIARESGTVSEDIIRNAFSATEDGFLALVRRTRQLKPSMATVGSCCLVGVIWRGTLYVANLGDSRAVIGCLSRSNSIIAEQLTRDHNASMEEVRHELRSLHPDDPQIVVMKHGVWRIKGIIQISRSIGDAYLKRPEIKVDSSFPRFQLSEPLRRSVLSAEPAVYSRVLNPQDKFVIFASDGLWEQLTNQQAVEIVSKFPRPGIARRLVRSALDVAAKKREMRYSDLKKLEKGIRRFFHDDITVIVVFIDHGSMLLEPNTSVPELSVRAFIDASGISEFSALEGLVTATGTSSV
ncbi:LOW QUALITY PROTEIN: probable protein phosphatase 2C 25 [Phalaenopsis equestris]|uniref:LOW QUALITY PROTEIN: probable protein phosphatase 2C 25 n=1 Tax=Phalaenopsis equestris TaxID=78828 RepID=UPI0009E29BAA|nr:LOW QUALITY PROTEIN: probable protein phosphatase 2C 25 [Phalaenopsis equestris]